LDKSIIMILITGGTGLLGTHLLPALINSGESVRVLIRESSDYRKILSVWQYYYKNPENLLEKIDWFRGDVTNKPDVYNALENVERVYHCAACVSFDRSKGHEMSEVNVQGTRYVVDMCLERNIKKLLYVSSVATIGPGIDNELLTEENKWAINPKLSYSKTKTLAEHEVWRGINEGLNSVIINPSIILGAGYSGENSYRFFETIFKGQKYYTNGVTGFVDVRDVVKIMIMLMNSEISGERFIVNGENLSYRDLFIKISDAFGMNPPVKHATKLMTSLAWRAELLLSVLSGRNPKITQQTAKSAHNIQRYSSGKLINQTGFTFTEIEDTIKDIVLFYLDQNSRDKK
jgi:dihydroflavonol-4-reductase